MQKRNKKVLLVDDDSSMRLLLSEWLLSANKYEVQTAADGLQGLMFFQRYKPDLVITDVLMPNKEGLEFIQDIKSYSLTSKVIALSGGGVLEVEECLKFANGFGADLVFSKPLCRQKLMAAVAGLLDDQLILTKKVLTSEEHSSC